MEEEKYYLLTQSDSKDSLILCKTDSIQQFYLLDLLGSSSVSFVISSKNDILLQSTIERDQILEGNKLEVILMSPDRLVKVVLQVMVSPINCSRQSFKSAYKILHQL